jgi:hypothetical protein
MKSKITNLFLGAFLFPIAFSCVDNELLEQPKVKETVKVFDLDFTSLEWLSLRPELTYKEIDFKEPNYDSLISLKFSLESVQGFIAVENNPTYENGLTLLQQKIGASSPQIKAYFENVEMSTLRNIIDPSNELDEGLEDFFRSLFESGFMGLILPSRLDGDQREPSIGVHNRNNSSTTANLRTMGSNVEGWEEGCEEDVYFYGNGMRKGLSAWREEYIDDIYLHYSPEIDLAVERYLERSNFINLLYKERIRIVYALVEQAIDLACHAGITDTVALRTQIQQLGMVYAYYIRTQLQVLYNAAMEWNYNFMEREVKMIEEERQTKFEELDAWLMEKANIISDWEDEAMETCTETGEFSYLDYEVIFGEEAGFFINN